VAQQYENVKDALDWREHFKRQPVAWSLGAAGVGFFVGYGIAAALTSDDDDIPYASAAYSSTVQRPARRELTGEIAKANGKDDGPGLLERFKETSAYDRLSQEAGALGDRLVEELSSTAQKVVLPALLAKIKNWIGLDLSDKSASMKSQEPRSSFETATSRAGDF
jgi:hypothetical protein